MSSIRYWLLWLRENQQPEEDFLRKLRVRIQAVIRDCAVMRSGEPHHLLCRDHGELSSEVNGSGEARMTGGDGHEVL